MGVAEHSNSNPGRCTGKAARPARLRREVFSIPGLFGILVALVGPPGDSRATPGPPGEDRSAIFRRYLSSPPHVKHVLFGYSDPTIDALPQRAESVVDGVKYVFTRSPTNLYLGAWQPKSFKLISCRSTPDLTASPELPATNFAFASGRAGDGLWLVNADGQVTLSGQPSPSEPATGRRPDFRTGRTVHANELFLLRAILLGFEDLEPGSIRWAKDEFRAVTRDKRQISGQLEVAEGISTPRRVRYRVAGGLTYEIDYAYRGDPSDTATSHLPSAFEVRSYVGGAGPGSTPEDFSRFELLRLELAAGEIGDAYFDPKPYRSTNVPRLWELEDGLYTTNGLGKLEPLGPYAAVSVPHQARAVWTGVVFMAFAVVTLAGKVKLMMTRHDSLWLRSPDMSARCRAKWLTSAAACVVAVSAYGTIAAICTNLGDVGCGGAGVCINPPPPAPQCQAVVCTKGESTITAVVGVYTSSSCTIQSCKGGFYSGGTNCVADGTKGCQQTCELHKLNKDCTIQGTPIPGTVTANCPAKKPDGTCLVSVPAIKK